MRLWILIRFGLWYRIRYETHQWYLTYMDIFKMMEWEINRNGWINWINGFSVLITWWLVFKLLNLLMLSFWYTFYVSFTREQSCGTSILMYVNIKIFLKFQYLFLLYKYRQVVERSVLTIDWLTDLLKGMTFSATKNNLYCFVDFEAGCVAFCKILIKTNRCSKLIKLYYIV